MKNRFVLLMIILTVIFLFGLFLQNIQSVEVAGPSDFNFLNSVDGWSSKSFEVENNVKEILETPYVFSVDFKKDKENIFLSVVYYLNKNVSFHMPEGCLTGEGSKLVSKKVRTLKTGFKCVELITKGSDGNTLIYYYFETDRLRSESYGAFKFQSIKNKIFLKKYSSALVRFSIKFTDDLDHGREVLDSFVLDVSPPISKKLGFSR